MNATNLEPEVAVRDPLIPRRTAGSTFAYYFWRSLVAAIAIGFGWVVASIIGIMIGWIPFGC